MLIKNIRELVTFTGSEAIPGNDPARATILHGVDLRVREGLIAEIGHDLSGEDEVIEASDYTVTPGYVDSHSHFVFGGNREDEYRLRLAGASYTEIMASGGGIQHSVEHTRKASLDELVRSGEARLKGFLEHGVTTVEGKSGYGLDLPTELLQLEAMQTLSTRTPQKIIPTFMGAHEVPKEYNKEGEMYLKFILEQVLPVVKQRNLAHFVDIFTEKNVFEIEESRHFLRAAIEMGFPVKLHADEIYPLDGAVLAGELKAVSADHLLRISDAGIEALRNSGTIATLLPLTAFSLKADYAPARKLLSSGVAVALASDYNPGSCHSYSMPLLIALSTIYMKMSMLEVLCALTINGAAALHQASSVGTIEVGKRADILLHRVPNLNYIPYLFGVNTVEGVIVSGKLHFDRRKAYVL